MSMLSLAELAGMVGGQLRGNDGTFDGVSSDTRTLQHGELFVALHGPNFDVHDYLQLAQSRGAAARRFAGRQGASAARTRAPLR